MLQGTKRCRPADYTLLFSWTPKNQTLGLCLIFPGIFVVKGGATVFLKVRVQFCEILFDPLPPHTPFAYLGQHEIEHCTCFNIVIMTSLNAYLHQMKLHNSGLCDDCGETETVGYFLINCTGNGVASNIKDACEKLQLDHSIKSVSIRSAISALVETTCSVLHVSTSLTLFCSFLPFVRTFALYLIHPTTAENRAKVVFSPF